MDYLICAGPKPTFYPCLQDISAVLDKIRAAAVAGTTAVVLAPVVVGAAGFTAGGVAAGSVAAGVQAGIGNVAAGTTFAALQSAGAAGFGWGTLTGIFSTVGATVGTACANIVS